MDCNEENISGVPPPPTNDHTRSAVNPTILEYYKKFGRKRDLEQYFSLSTAQGDIRDPSGAFWSRMKAENESSDSGEKSDKKSESSQELCRISIRFPAQDPCTSQEEDSKTKTESVSPPIIMEEASQDSRQNSEDEALKSDDNNSQKSYDVLLDTSTNKPHSPSSSITSQRKLEWDSLADVGYANESDRKTSASSLSTLERLALKQQYSNNDTQQGSDLGLPTAHSTPLDENETKTKSKKGVGKKSTKIYKRDVDIVEVNVPHSSNMNQPQSINVNLTKHISFNVEKDGKVTVDNLQKDVTPEKNSVETEMSPRLKTDKEMQTSLTKVSNTSSNISENVQPQTQPQKIPILISLNTLRNRIRRKRLRMARRRLKSKKSSDKKEIQAQEKSGEQLSEAESFEYMPGHIYNQNQMTANNRPSNAADNKSSLESSGVLTSDSSKGSKHSFAKDLEKSIDLLKIALQQPCDDSTLRKQLIKQVCQRLLKSRYRDDDSTTDFLSGLSFGSKKLGLGEGNNTTTSTSDANNSADTSKRPKKSILRTDKFNAGSIASTSQSVPNLPVASNSENLVTSNLAKNVSSSNTESDVSSKERTSSDNVFVKTSSEELYKKYLQALKREEAYKRHLKDKEMFLKQKLVSSDSIHKAPARVEVKPINRLKDLINDLTRNNYDDGSGDASKLEGGPGSNRDFNRFLPNRGQRSHSVFTLSSGNSDVQNTKPNLKKSLQCDTRDLSKPGPSKDSHYCCCPHHSRNLKFTDSSVQVNIKNPCVVDSCPARNVRSEEQKEESPRNISKVIDHGVASNIKYVCLCNKKVFEVAPDDFMVGKYSQLCNKVQLSEIPSKASDEVLIQCNDQTCDKTYSKNYPSTSKGLFNKSSQTNMLIKMLQEQPDLEENDKIGVDESILQKNSNSIYEATRWIQTEISINPKISEPSLSDINIVSDTNCAKLIGEQYREPLKPSLTSVFTRQTAGSVVSATSGSCKSSGSSKESKDVEKKVEDPIYNVIEKSKNEIENRRTNIDHTENFTIPIHGTNMTLMVSIGSECKVCTNKKTEAMIGECVGTDQMNGVEQATCLTEECSKGVQFSITNDNTINTVAKNDIQNNMCQKGCFHCEKNEFRDLLINTYRCKVQKNEKSENSQVDAIKKFIEKIFCNKGSENDRSKLDEKLFCECRSCIENSKSSPRDETNLGDQIKIFDNRSEKSSHMCVKNDCKSIECESSHCEKLSPEDGVSTQTDNHDINDNKVVGQKDMPTFSGHCNNPKYNRGDLTINLESSFKKPYKENTLDVQLSLQENLLFDNQSQKSSSRCGSAKDNYKLGSKELTLSPKKQYEVQFTNKGMSAQNDILLKENLMCPCGSGSAKENCKKSCIDLQSSPKIQCGVQTVEQTSTQKEILLSEINQCPCGCGGMKDKCKRSWREPKSSPRKQCGKQTTERIDTQTDMPFNQNEDQNAKFNLTSRKDSKKLSVNKCSCGCEGLNDKCKKSCIELISSPREEYQIQSTEKQIDAQTDMTLNENEKCLCGCDGTKKYCKKSCNELKSFSCDPYGKQSTNAQLDAQTDMSFNQYVKCSCGCTGTLDRCKKSCKELKLSSKEQYQKKSTVKQIDIQTDLPSNQYEKCPCGCGGTKNDCKDLCVGLKLPPKNHCSKDSEDKTMYTDPKVPNVHSEKCRCGCGGLKGNCKSSCKELTSSPKSPERKKSDVGTQKYLEKRTSSFCRKDEIPNLSNRDVQVTANSDNFKEPVQRVNSGEQTDISSLDKDRKSTIGTEQTDALPDRILSMVQNITKRFTKKDTEKIKRKKCLKEIVTVLNYLLDTDDSTDQQEDKRNNCDSASNDASIKKVPEKQTIEKNAKKLMDKEVQLSSKESCVIESSDLPISSDMPETSSHSSTCKVLNKIKKECERYHQKRCKIHSGKKCDGTSTTSVNCDQCRRIHHCSCRNHKCKCRGYKKSNEKLKKTSIAYNLILQPSESLISDGTIPTSSNKNRILKNIIVKVPKKKPNETVPLREMAAKIERRMFLSNMAPNDPRSSRSKSLPNESEISSMDEIIRQSQGATVREYLEKNRPDFIESCSQRQNCLRFISESRADERAFKRHLLSMYLAQLPDVTELDTDELRQLAKDLGRHLRQKQPAPKFISEREMKKHSEKIYKSLPEVVKKKEDKKKENIKKTNLLMANMFKRNLQKKTLRGSVNLSNYSTVIKM